MTTATTKTDILRPAAPPDSSLKGKLTQWGMAHMDDLFRVIRTLWPIPTFGKFAMVTRCTDVQEVMSLRAPAIKSNAVFSDLISASILR